MGMAWSNTSKASNREGQPYGISLLHCAWLGVTVSTQLQGTGRPPESQNKLCLLQRPLVLLQALVTFKVSREMSVGEALQL